MQLVLGGLTQTQKSLCFPKTDGQRVKPWPQEDQDWTSVSHSLGVAVDCLQRRVGGRRREKRKNL